jgi:hypothetical protein
MGLLKRIETLEGQLLRARQARECICYPYGASFHNVEEMEKAREIPCPVHGKPRFKVDACSVHLGIDMPLAPADRHLCHCPPRLWRTALEQGRALTGEEAERARAQDIENWEQACAEMRNRLALAD